MDTLTNKVAYPCDAATEAQIFSAVFGVSNAEPDDCEKLQRIIVDIPEDLIPWSHIHTLCIVGNANDNCNAALARARIQPGVYISHSGNFLFLILMEGAVLQTCMDRCGKLLESLVLCNTDLSYLDLSSLTELKILFANQNRDLARLNGLEHLSKLIELSLLGSPRITQLPSFDNLTSLTKLDLSSCFRLTHLPALDKLTKLTILRLYECHHLTQLPSLDSLINLTELDVSVCTSLTQLPKMDSLSNLTVLDISACENLTHLPPLDCLTNLAVLNLIWCNNLTRLPPLNHITKLTALNLSDCNNLTQIPPLDGLINLTELDFSECSNLAQIPPLDNLTNLSELNLSECIKLTHVPSLDRLSNLSELILSGCSKLRELPAGIRNLKSLRRLDLSNMHLLDLPDWMPEIAENFSLRFHYWAGGTKANVYLKDTTVDSIPDMSIFEQPFDVIVKWFAERKLGRTQPLNEIKVVFLGDGESGKSHTIARLINDGGTPVDYMDQSTPGIVIKDKAYSHNGRDFRVHYWDFGGQEIMHSMHRIFLTGRTMYVVLLNARDDTQGDRARYWLHNVKSFAPDAPVLLVLNKIDQNEKASVDEKDLRGRYPRLTEIVKLSAKEFSKETFNETFTHVLLEEIQKTGYLDAQWPVSWTKVKERLEKMTDHYIMGDAYQTICQECSVDSNQQNLLHWFNDLGISFCWCDEEEDYALEDHVILRPDWITNALYIILFNHLVGAHNGLIPHKSIYKLLKNAHSTPSIRCTLPDAKYSNGDIQYVLGVMRKFNLSFDPTLVRGMSYYTGTIFEIKSDDFKGSSIAGGGRYDNMIGNFTGTPTCACGFSIGFERLVGALLDKKFKAPGSREKVAVLYGKSFESGDVARIQNKCRALREEGKIVLVQRMNKNVGFQKQKLEADGYTKFIDIRNADEIDSAL